jgi:hypothetical protein
MNISLSTKYEEKLAAIASHLGVSKSEAVRRAVDAMYAEFQKTLYGYKGVKVAERRMAREDIKSAEQEAIERLTAMSADELQDYLRKIEYLRENEYIRPGVSGHELWNITYSDGVETSSRSVFTWPELVRDLKKEKKLIN